MSNQVGLILSFIFLSFFLLLSGEVITYQQISVKSMSYLNDIALYIQNYGYDEVEIEKLASYSYFDKVEINVIENDDYYIINVSEGSAPTVSFTDGSNETTMVNVAKGTTHQIKQFVATDNTTPSENLKVYKMILDEAFVIEANGYNVDSYTFTEAGTYIVYVLVYDALGNSAASYYKVIVS